jgi:hypothetical protein
MSALNQKRTFRSAIAMSALSPKADTACGIRIKVPNCSGLLPLPLPAKQTKTRQAGDRWEI